MSPVDTAKLGAFLTAERKRLGLSVPALADQAGLSKSTVLRLERGEFARPDATTLTTLAAALGREPEDILAVAGYLPAASLPGFAPYLRAKLSGDLPEEALQQLEDYYDLLRLRYDEEGGGGDQPGR